MTSNVAKFAAPVKDKLHFSQSPVGVRFPPMGHRPAIEIPDSYIGALMDAIRASGKKYRELRITTSMMSALQHPTEKHPRTYSGVITVLTKLARIGIAFEPPVVAITGPDEYKLILALRGLRKKEPAQYQIMIDAIRQSTDRQSFEVDFRMVTVKLMAEYLTAGAAEERQAISVSRRDNERPGPEAEKHPKHVGRHRRNTERD